MARYAAIAHRTKPGIAFRDLQYARGVLAGAGRRCSAALSRSVALDEPQRILEQTLEPGVFRNDRRCDLSARLRGVRPPRRDSGRVCRLRAAARTCHQRPGEGRLRRADAVLSAAWRTYRR